MRSDTRSDFDGKFELRFGNHTYVVAEDIRITNEGWSENNDLLSVGHHVRHIRYLVRIFFTIYRRTTRFARHTLQRRKGHRRATQLGYGQGA